MPQRLRFANLVALVSILASIGVACSPPEAGPVAPEATPVTRVRIATFNVQELSRAKLDEIDETGRGTSPQLRKAAEIVQRIQPDVLLINEIDFDTEGRNAELFLERYLAVGQRDQQGLAYPHVFFREVNTGVLSGHDLDRDGNTDSAEDAWGFGRYPGQYGMAVYSRWPIDAAAVRTFRLLRWSAQPDNLMPDGVRGKPAWYPTDVAAELRLSSKSHWDLPIEVGGSRLHLLASHPTPPVFDGDEDRNGRRNFDEIRLWADYLNGGEEAAWIVDDAGAAGGLPRQSRFVILGDLNADPFGSAAYGQPAIRQLQGHPRVRDPAPRGPGGAFATRPYDGDPTTRTSDWGRLDYVLPSADLEVGDSGVFWPPPGDPLAELVEGEQQASDHRLVWVDLAIAP